MMKVVCLEDFYIDSAGSRFKFIKGEKYNYFIDFIEMICDEMAFHSINGIPVTEETLRENFILLDEYRDRRINILQHE